MQIKEASINNKRVAEMWLNWEKVFPPVNIPYDKLLAYYNCAGLSNQDEGREVLKDLTGNGYDLQLNNFAFGGMSGYGGFLENFNEEWTFSTVTVSWLSQNDNSAKFKRKTASTSYNTAFVKNLNTAGGLKLRLKITGLDDFITKGGKPLFTRWLSMDGTASSNPLYISEDGEYEFNSTEEYPRFSCFSATESDFDIDIDHEITIEQLPEYPGALVFDGVDDSAISLGNGIKFKDESYTIIPIFEVIEFTQRASNIISKPNFFLYNDTNGYNWYNMRVGGSTKLPKEDLIGITNNKAYYSTGEVILDTIAQTGDVFARISIGGGITYPTNMAKYALAIFDGVNLNYRQCKEVYEDMINNTLINKLK